MSARVTEAQLLRECQKLLADLINPDPAFQSAVSSQVLWARAVELERRLRSAAGGRRAFPILGSGGQTIDFALVADHAEQAKKNHYQTVARLAERGGLSWSELYAVLHNKPWAKMDENEAVIACRALEARYLAAVAAAPHWRTRHEHREGVVPYLSGAVQAR